MPIDDLKQQIKDTPISRIIGHYLPLSKRGNQTLAICPFHQDTKPSLNVNDSKGMFMCFACNTGGDHITFVEKYKKLNFIDSLEEICKIIGLEFEDYKDKKSKNPELEMARKILNKAIQIYQKISTENPHFLAFAKERNIKNETSKEFKLGFALSSNILSNYLLSIKNENERNLALKVAINLKIIHHDKIRQGNYFDSFRDRIMFPIYDAYKNPMGFTSRSIRESQKPKYLNSSESIAFTKKRLLYGVDLAKPYIRERDQIILCEGNMDAITLHQKGFQNAVAIMGTAYNGALTSTIKSMTKNVILALDSDNAGYEAARRINQFFLKEGVICRFISFHPFKDPDEFLTEKGAMDLQNIIESSPTFIDHELETIRMRHKPKNLEKKIEVIQMAIQLLEPLGANVYKKEKIAEFSRSIGIKSSPEELLAEFGSKAKGNEFGQKLPRHSNSKVSKTSISDGKYEKSVCSISKSMELAVREILKNPEVMEQEKWAEMLDLLSPNEVKMWFASIQDLYFEVGDQDFNSMVLDVVNKDDVDSNFKSIVGAAIFQSKDKTPLDTKGQNRLLTDLIKRMKKEQLISKRETLFKQHQDAPSNEQETILKKINEIQIEIKNIN